MSFFSRLFSTNKINGSLFAGHKRLTMDPMPDVVYVVGDVHGEYELLKSLEHLISNDAEGYQGEKWIIYVGDLVDRGADSASVLDYFTTQHNDQFKRLVLLGNHEHFFLQTLNGDLAPEKWLSYGGAETIMSYYGNALPDFMQKPKIDVKKFKEFMYAVVPQDHIEFMMTMPLSVEFPNFVIAHAGVRHDVPFCDQDPMDLIMIRDGFIDVDFEYDKIIIHGHTVQEKAHKNGSKIGIDTGAYATKTLSAVRVTPDGKHEFLSTGNV